MLSRLLGLRKLKFPAFCFYTRLFADCQQAAVVTMHAKRLLVACPHTFEKSTFRMELPGYQGQFTPSPEGMAQPTTKLKAKVGKSKSFLTFALPNRIRGERLLFQLFEKLIRFEK
jgi:hypothetical protein